MDEDRIERIARAICRAARRDPDALQPSPVVRVGALSSLRPFWMAYRDEARRFVMAQDGVALRAMSPASVAPSRAGLDQPILRGAA